MLKPLKRLLFPQHDNVDGIWSTIAQSVASGPLKEAGVVLAKVAPTPSSPGDHVRPSFPLQSTSFLVFSTPLPLTHRRLELMDLEGHAFSLYVHGRRIRLGRSQEGKPSIPSLLSSTHQSISSLCRSLKSIWG